MLTKKLISVFLAAAVFLPVTMQAITTSELQSLLSQIQELQRLVSALQSRLSGSYAVTTSSVAVAPDNLTTVRTAIGSAVLAKRLDSYRAVNYLRTDLGTSETTLPLRTVLKEYLELGGSIELLATEFTTVEDLVAFFEGARIQDYADLLTAIDAMGGSLENLSASYGSFKGFLQAVKSDYAPSRLPGLVDTLEALRALGASWTDVAANGGYADAKDFLSSLKSKNLEEISDLLEKLDELEADYDRLVEDADDDAKDEDDEDDEETLEEIINDLESLSKKKSSSSGSSGSSSKSDLGFLSDIFGGLDKLGSTANQLTRSFGGFDQMLSSLTGGGSLGNMAQNVGKLSGSSCSASGACSAVKSAFLSTDADVAKIDNAVKQLAADPAEFDEETGVEEEGEEETSFSGEMDPSCQPEDLAIREKLLPDSRTSVRSKPIDTIVIHDTDPGEGSDDAFTSSIKLSSNLDQRVQGVYNTWLQSNSAHYLIEHGGPLTVYRFVPDDRVASHVAGQNPTPTPPDTSARTNINTFSIGVELAYTGWWDKQNGSNGPNDQQYDALGRLIKCLKRKNPAIKQVILHCQASQNNGKEDPRNFKFSKIASTLDGLGIQYKQGGGNCRQ